MIFSAIDEVNERLPGGERLEKSIDTTLFGESGKLDSLGLVNLIVAIEQKIEDEYGITVVLAEEGGLGDMAPFATTGNLVNHVSWILERKGI
jgi:acyl carrier protein